MNETLKTLQERRSIRRYSKQQVDEAALNAILEGLSCVPPEFLFFTFTSKIKMS